MGNVKRSVAERTRHKRQYDSRMNERQMQSKEGKVDSSKALDDSLVVTKCSAIESENSNSDHALNKSVNESSGTESRKQDRSSSSGNYLTHVVDATIRPLNDQVPSVEITLQASFLKEKKGVHFSVLYLQKKRNLLVFDHSHQHSLNFPMLVQSLSGSTSTWSLNVYEMVKLTPGYISSGLVQNPVSPTPYVPPSKKDYEILFQLLCDEYFNPPPRAISPDPVAVAAPRAVDPADSPSSTTIDQDVPLLVLHQQIRKFNLKSLIKLFQTATRFSISGNHVVKKTAVPKNCEDGNPTRANIKQALRFDADAGNPVKEILLNLNLPDHKSVLTDPEVHVKMEMEIPRSSKVKFITACLYSFDKYKDMMKAQIYVIQVFYYFDTQKVFL
ncbi:hypothetical protein Tco_1335445 [Tanacetum coccineum]